MLASNHRARKKGSDDARKARFSSPAERAASTVAARSDGSEKSSRAIGRRGSSVPGKKTIGGTGWAPLSSRRAGGLPALCLAAPRTAAVVLSPSPTALKGRRGLVGEAEDVDSPYSVSPSGGPQRKLRPTPANPALRTCHVHLRHHTPGFAALLSKVT